MHYIKSSRCISIECQMSNVKWQMANGKWQMEKSGWVERPSFVDSNNLPNLQTSDLYSPSITLSFGSIVPIIIFLFEQKFHLTTLRSAPEGRNIRTAPKDMRAAKIYWTHFLKFSANDQASSGRLQDTVEKSCNIFGLLSAHHPHV